MDHSNSEPRQRPQSRRQFLKLTGIGTAGLYLGYRGLAAQSQVNYNHDAYALWHQKEKGTLSDLEYLTLCGTLACNPHNTQPWKVQLKADSLELFADKNRWLGAADPEKRMMRLGMGCMLENIRVAARRLGYQPRLELDADQRFEADGHCATVHLHKTGHFYRHPWFDALFERRSNRAPFDPLSHIPMDFMREMNREAIGLNMQLDWYDSEANRDAIRFLSTEAARLWVGNHQRHVDGMRWFRLSRKEWEQKRDGLSLYTSTAPLVFIKFAENLENQTNLYRDGWKFAEIKTAAAVAEGTPMWSVIHSKDTSHNGFLKAGQMLERLFLEATWRGLKMSVLCYATELPAMAAQMKTSLKLPSDHTVMALVRVGKGPTMERSVRRELKDVIMS